MNKFLLTGLAALLSVSLFLTGCSTEADPDIKYVDKEVPEAMIHLDVTVSTLDELAAQLSRPDDLAIGFQSSTTATLGHNFVIPEGKTVYVLSGTVLDVSANDLTVEGALYVGAGATVKAESTGLIHVTDGTVHVVPPAGTVLAGGLLSVKSAISVDSGTGGDTAFGTPAVSIAGALTIKDAIAAITGDGGVNEALGYLSSGELDVTTSLATTAVTGITGVSETKRLTITTASTGGSGGSVSVPEWVSVKTADDLSTVNSITVAENGAFYADNGTTVGDTSGGVAVVVNGHLYIEKAIKFKNVAEVDGATPAVPSSVGAKGSVAFAAAAGFTGTSLAVVEGSTVYAGAKGIIFPAATSITAVVGTAGSEGVTIEDIEVPGTGVLAASLEVTVAADNAITLNPGAAIYGTVKAGATTIYGGGPPKTGGWRAAGTVATVISVHASTPVATITGGILSGGTGSSITQAAEANNGLTIAANTTVDITDGATVTLTGTTTAANIGKLVLTGGATAGLLIVDSAKATAVTTAGKTTITLQIGVSPAGTDASVNLGTGAVIKGADSDADTAKLLGSISGGSDTNNTTITAPSTANNPVIAKGSYVLTA